MLPKEAAARSLGFVRCPASGDVNKKASATYARSWELSSLKAALCNDADADALLCITSPIPYDLGNYHHPSLPAFELCVGRQVNYIQRILKKIMLHQQRMGFLALRALNDIHRVCIYHHCQPLPPTRPVNVSHKWYLLRNLGYDNESCSLNLLPRRDDALIILVSLSLFLFAGCWLERRKGGICSRERITLEHCSNVQLQHKPTIVSKSLQMAEDVSVVSRPFLEF